MDLYATYVAPDCSQVVNARCMLDIRRALLIYARLIMAAMRQQVALWPTCAVWPIGDLWRRPWWPGVDLRGAELHLPLAFGRLGAAHQEPSCNRWGAPLRHTHGRRDASRQPKTLATCSRPIGAKCNLPYTQPARDSCFDPIDSLLMFVTRAWPVCDQFVTFDGGFLPGIRDLWGTLL